MRSTLLLTRCASILLSATAFTVSGCSSSSDPEATVQPFTLAAGVGSQYTFESIDDDGSKDTGRVTLADDHAAFGGETNTIILTDDESDKVIWAFKYLAGGDVKATRLFDSPSNDWWTIATTSTKPITTTFYDTLWTSPSIRHRITNFTSQFKSKETVTVGGKSYEGRRFSINTSEQDYEDQAQKGVDFVTGEMVFVPVLGTYSEISLSSNDAGKEVHFSIRLIGANVK